MKNKLMIQSVLAIAVFLICFSVLSQNAAISAEHNSVGTAQRIDNLPDAWWWKAKVQQQVLATRNQEFQACLFGDSISSPLGNSLGKQRFNFAIGGLSSVSLVKQLSILADAGVQCQKTIIEIGTNDAWYTIADDAFLANLRQTLELLRSMGATEIVLLPAFYSTVEASYDPNKAGPIERVDEISGLIRQVAASEKVAIADTILQPLFEGRSLKANLTFDGVHLNEAGKQIYRALLLELI